MSLYINQGGQVIDQFITLITQGRSLLSHDLHIDDLLIEIGDLVTEMELKKHPFRSGIKAQIGVEF